MHGDPYLTVMSRKCSQAYTIWLLTEQLKAHFGTVIDNFMSAAVSMPISDADPMGDSERHQADGPPSRGEFVDSRGAEGDIAVRRPRRYCAIYLAQIAFFKSPTRVGEPHGGQSKERGR